MATVIETLFDDRKLIVFPERAELRLMNLTTTNMENAFLSPEGAHALIKALEPYARAPLPLVEQFRGLRMGARFRVDGGPLQIKVAPGRYVTIEDAPLGQLLQGKKITEEGVSWR